MYPPDSDPETADAIAELLKREPSPALQAAAERTELATVLGQEVPIVQRGALVALEFRAAVSRTRAIGERYIDVGGIDRVMRAGFHDEDRALALEIADTMYPGARDELAQMLEDLRNIAR